MPVSVPLHLPLNSFAQAGPDRIRKTGDMLAAATEQRILKNSFEMELESPAYPFIVVLQNDEVISL